MMKAISVHVQVRTIQVPNPMPRIRRALASFWETICLVIHYTLLLLGILAAVGFILSLIFPNAAGNVIAWGLYELLQFVRGLS